MKAEPTKAQIEELDALAGFNDVIPRPSAIWNPHWDGEAGYRVMCEAGWVKRYARPPRGWGKDFFGVRITPLGRQVLAEAREKEGRRVR